MKIRKIVLSLVGIVLLLLIVGVVILIASINSIAKKGVEVGGTYALGVPTTVKAIDIGILGGTLGIDSLKVGNAAGFPTDHFLTLGDAKVAVKLTSLTGDTIYVPEITLSNIDVALEKKDGKSNYQVILDNLSKLSGPAGTNKPAPAPSGGGGGASQKKFIIHELTIKNVNVHADLLGAPGVIGEATKVNVPVPEIKLTDVGQTGNGMAGSGVTISELSGLVVQAVLSAAVAKGGLPADFVGDLTGQLGKLGDLAGGAGKQVAEQAQAAAKQLGQVGDQIGKQAESISKDIGKEAEGVTDKLKGIIPGGGDKKKNK